MDIINWSSTLVILYLMADLLWITICISWVLGKISRKPLRNAVKIDLYSSDNVGGLGPLRNLILFLALFQFGILSLAVANFSSDESYSLTVIFFIILFLFSVYLFLKGWSVIDNLLEDNRTKEVDLINRIYRYKRELWRDAMIENDTRLKVDIDELSNSMDVLSSERERLLNANKTAYDYKAIFVFITSSLLPFMAQYLIPIFKK